MNDSSCVDKPGPTLPLTRRGFLHAGQLALAVAIIGRVPPAMSAARIELDAAIVEAFMDWPPQQARRIGASYLAANPGRADRRALLDHLGWNETPSASLLLPHLCDLRRTQFAHEHIVNVDGWLLAACEADACALLSLQS